MRRSGAPSVKLNTIKSIHNSPVANTMMPKSATNIKKTNNENINQIKQCTTKGEGLGNQIFNVVWSRRTTKKHKTWEGDGFLIVRPKLAILKDQNHQTLGTTNSLKPEEIVEGQQVIIGGKEVEILEKLSITHLQKRNNQNQVNNDDNKTAKVDEYDIDEPKEKKKKFCGIFVPNLQLSASPNMKNKFPKINLNRSKNSSDININEEIVSNDESLILAPPNYVSQCEFNKNKGSIVEVKVHPQIVKHLRPHQKEGIRFLYECLLGFKNKDYFGAILADEMGLGKTLQCIALCHTLLKQGPFGGERCLQRVLIVAPSSLAENWNKEIRKWLDFDKMYTYVVDIKHKIQNYLKQNHIPFVIVSYETLVANIEYFESIKFDLLICDEGHRLKNKQIKASAYLLQLNIPRRLILTGTPIQNDLEEFFHLVEFVNPGILGTYQEFKFLYENPICKSQQPDATEECQSIGLEQAKLLNNITEKFIIRRTQALNQKYLPKKREYIVFIRPSKLQIILIRKCLELYQLNVNDGLKDCYPLLIINVLQKICDHPSLLTCTSSDNVLLKSLIKMLPNWKNLGISDSSKMEVLKNLLEQTLQLNEKIVIVSNSTKTMDMIKIFLEHAEYKYLRLDGKTPAIERQSIVNKFNKKNNQYQVFLLSAKAGGMGLNLYGASKLILFDNDWNPSVDLQAMSRIWRDGQEKDVKIYRFITAGTIEEKILQRQISKTNLSGCLIGNNSNSSLKFSKEDLKDLFSVKDDFNICSTHESLQCTCQGVGEINQIPPNDEQIDDPYGINLSHLSNNESKDALQVNELMKWEHYKPPFISNFIKESSLETSSDQILFIFSNLIEFIENNT